MHRGFTKLFNTIVTSTIWQEDDKTRIVWITMLAIADAFGNVFAAIPGLARVSNVSLEACEKAIGNLKSNDAYSRTKDFEGRRIEEIEGGWHILNYEKYRRMMNEEERREYKAKWISEKRRQKSTSVDKRRRKSTLSTQAEAEVEEEANNKEGANGSRPPVVNKIFDFEKWIESIIADPTYARIDVRREYGKMVAWCKVRGKQPTQRRFINWLNNVDAGLPTPAASTAGVYGKNRLPPPSDITEEQLATHRAQIQKLSEQWKKEHGV